MHARFPFAFFSRSVIFSSLSPFRIIPPTLFPLVSVLHSFVFGWEGGEVSGEVLLSRRIAPNQKNSVLIGCVQAPFVGQIRNVQEGLALRQKEGVQ